MTDDGYYFWCPENQLIVETPSGSILIQSPAEQCDQVQYRLPVSSPSAEELVYASKMPIARDPLIAFKPFNHKSSSIPLVKRHVAQLIQKKLPCRSHPVFDRPPDSEGPLAAVLPPITQQTSELCRADPGFSLTDPKPDPKLLVDSSLNLREFSLAHFDCCPSCEAHGGAKARQLDHDPSIFSTAIFSHFHPTCYAQHLFRGLWYGYNPALLSPITPFSLSNYKSLYDPLHRHSLEKAWSKQLRVPLLFAPGDPSFVSPLTLATRFIDRWEAELNGGIPKARVCFDASRGINEHLAPWKFRYSDLPYIVSHVKRGDWIAQLDLRSWYLQLCVRKSFQKYLSLRCPLTGKLLRYRRLPFGLSTAPGFASLVSSEICKIIRAAGFKCFITSYIDDLTFIASSREEAQRALDYALRLLEQFGIGVAPEKIFQPSQCATVLGVIIDTLNGKLRARPEHIQWTLRVVKAILKRKRLTKRKLQSLAGMLNWVSPMCPGSRPFIRSLWDLVSSTKKTIRASPAMLADLRWWRSALNRLSRRSCQMPFLHWDERRKVVMFSDASGDVGCGIWIGNRFLRHRWSAEELTNSVPYKELWPIMKILELHGQELAGSILLTCTDSATNSFSINAGSSRAPGCLSLLKAISRLERVHQVDVIALWCPREFNTITDHLSKFSLHGADLLSSADSPLFLSPEDRSKLRGLARDTGPSEVM